MACEGGTDLDVDACVVEAGAQRASAEVYDCADSSEKYFDCVEATAVCDAEKGRLEDACKETKEAFKKCGEAASARD